MLRRFPQKYDLNKPTFGYQEKNEKQKAGFYQAGHPQESKAENKMEKAERFGF